MDRIQYDPQHLTQVFISLIVAQVPEYKIYSGCLPLHTAYIHPLQGMYIKLPHLIWFTHKWIRVDADEESLLLRGRSNSGL